MQYALDSDSLPELDASMPADTGGAGSAWDGPPAPLPPLALPGVPEVVAAVAVPQVIRTNSQIILSIPSRYVVLWSKVKKVIQSRVIQSMVIRSIRSG
jgi:hypothetical protein